METTEEQKIGPETNIIQEFTNMNLRGEEEEEEQDDRDFSVNNHEHYYDDDEEEEEEEFSFVLDQGANNTSTDEKINPIFPLFNKHLFFTDEELKSLQENLPPELSVKKVFVETNHGGDSHLVTSASPGSDEIAGPCCEWSGDCKKSNSTGFSKLWRFKDFVGRSSSDGKDAFVFLNKSHAPPRQMLPGTARRGKTAPLSAHAVYLKNKAKDGDRRRSYLPYRPELMGFFTNANVGFTRNVHPY